ncbi:hypothetical protein ABIA38_002218 [Embleya sp. AB8]
MDHRSGPRCVCGFAALRASCVDGWGRCGSGAWAPVWWVWGGSGASWRGRGRPARVPRCVGRELGRSGRGGVGTVAAPGARVAGGAGARAGGVSCGFAGLRASCVDCLGWLGSGVRTCRGWGVGTGVVGVGRELGDRAGSEWGPWLRREARIAGGAGGWAGVVACGSRLLLGSARVGARTCRGWGVGIAGTVAWAAVGAGAAVVSAGVGLERGESVAEWCSVACCLVGRLGRRTRRTCRGSGAGAGQGWEVGGQAGYAGQGGGGQA